MSEDKLQQILPTIHAALDRASARRAEELRPYAFRAIESSHYVGDKIDLGKDIAVEMTRSRVVTVAIVGISLEDLENDLDTAFGALYAEIAADAKIGLGLDRTPPDKRLVVTSPAKIPPGCTVPDDRMSLFFPDPEVAFSLSLVRSPSYPVSWCSTRGHRILCVESCWVITSLGDHRSQGEPGR